MPTPRHSASSTTQAIHAPRRARQVTSTSATVRLSARKLSSPEGLANTPMSLIGAHCHVGYQKGVTFLRASGVEKVVLFAHSGGGPLMSLYQAVAEKGPAWCKGPDKLVECSDELADTVSDESLRP